MSAFDMIGLLLMIPGNDRDVALAVERSDAFPGFNRVV